MNTIGATSTAVEDGYPSRQEPTPVRLARQDPVLWGPGEDGPLSADQLGEYEERGFLLLPGLLGQRELAAIQYEAAWLRNLDETSDAKVIAEPGSNVVRSVFAVHQSSEVFRGLAADPRVAGAARQILGSDVYVHQSRLNFKPPFDGREFWWHSDFETWHVEDGMPRMRALSASILLNENTPCNGPTMFMPGSHRHFVACVGETPDQHYLQSLKKQEYGVPDRDSLTWLSEQGGVEAPTGPAGSVVLFDCNTMHGSGGNITPQPRVNFFVVFNSVHNALVAPFSGQAPRPEHIGHRQFRPVIA